MKKSNYIGAPACFSIAVFLFIASFNAWRDQRINGADLQKKLAEISRPVLSATVLQTSHAPIPSNMGNGTAMLIMLEVRNTGAESIVDGYRVSAVTDSGKVVSGSIHIVPEALTFLGAKETLIIHSKDSLFDKTATEPIRHNGKAVGHLWVWFHDLDNFSPKYVVIRFRDINRKQYETDSRSCSDCTGHFSHFPGMSY